MMFKIKKTIEQGKCAAMRCVAPCFEAGRLCQKHDEIWRGEGSPPLESAAPPAAKSTSLAVHVPEALQGRLDQERLEAQEVLRFVQGLPTETPQQREAIAGAFNEAKAKLKELETERKSVTGPLNQIKKTIDGWFKPVEDFYKAVADSLEGHLLAWERTQKLLRADALKEIAAGAGQASPAAFQQAHQDVSLPDQVGTRRKLVYEITDWAALPGRYKMMVANHQVIQEDVAAQGLALNVPGLRVFEEGSLVKGRE